MMNRDTAIKILAKSIYRELKTSGYDKPNEVVALTTELLGLVSTEINDGVPTAASAS